MCGIAKLLGRTFDQFPKRTAAQQVLKEVGIGAKAELCAQLLLWLEECGPQTISACIDAASIGEDKYEGIAFVRKYFSEPHNPKQPYVFKRIALGLIDLVNGTDEHKHIKILELMQDCIDCYNFVHEPIEPVTLVHMAMLVGYTCNDHAESTVPNQFVPWIRKLLTDEVGTRQHYHQFHCLFFKLGRDAQLKRDEYQSLADVFLRAVFSHDYRRIVADKVVRNQYNCGTHRAALMEGGMLTGMSRFEASKGVTLPGAATPAAEPAPPGQRQVKAARGSTLIQNATYTAAKKYGKGKEHETLTRTKAFSLCRDYAEKAKLYFERVIGPRGASAVSGNAEPTFVMMMEDDDWSMLHMLGAEDAIKKGSNRMHDSALDEVPDLEDVFFN